MDKRIRERIGEGVDAFLLARLSGVADNRKLGGTATYAVRFEQGADLAIPGPDPEDSPPDLVLIGVTDGEVLVKLDEGSCHYVNPDPQQGELPEGELLPGESVRLPVGGYAALQSKGKVTGSGGGHSHTTITTQGGKCKVCP